ncbi:MAG: DUF190 domain-containing protein [Firmicutes bacterium]|nr:DUF190 domain-containing protein [Bacillota bacterium]
MKYNLITIYTSEAVRWKGKPLYSAVCDYIVSLNIAARCIVTNGIAGCYENGVLASAGIEVISQNLPCKIEIILPDREAETVLSTLGDMVADGLISVSEVDVRVSHVSHGCIPHNIRVRDIMTPNPVSISVESSAADAVKLLARAEFKGLPVIDSSHKPVGIVTQSDLTGKAGLRVRPQLLADFSWEQVDDLVKPLGWVKVSEIMTAPVVCLGENEKVSSAVALMLNKGRKRFPVTDKNGNLIGMFARSDVFRMVTGSNICKVDYTPPESCHGMAKFVKDVMTGSTETVHPKASIEEVIIKISTDRLQRVVVTDDSGKFKGMISDKDLLVLFLSRQINVWEHIVSSIPFSEAARTRKAQLASMKIRYASDVMKTDITTVNEETTIHDAVKIMTEKKLSRLPVVDSKGKFRGIISQEDILRVGAGEMPLN